MREDLKHFTDKIITLNDGSQFYYSVQLFEMRSILGTAITLLDEYIFTKKGSNESFKLYKTKDGNWYTIDKENCSEKDAVLRNLKLALELQNEIEISNKT